MPPADIGEVTVTKLVRPLLVGVLVVTALAAPSPVSRPEPASAYTTIFYNGAGDAPHIGLIGDSTLAATRWYGILGGLTRYNFVLDAESCRRTTHTSCRGREGYAPENTLTVMRRLEGRWGRVLVLMTGYDDPGFDFGDAIDAVMREAISQGIPRVMWLTFRTADVTYVGPTYNSDLHTFRDNNKLLLQKALRYGGRLQIANWAGHSARHPEWVASDGVHLTPAGTVAVTEFIADKVADVLAGRTITPPRPNIPRCRTGVVLRQRDRLTDVNCLERHLASLGFPVAVDHRYGPTTVAAVKFLDYARSWPRDGVANRRVLKAIGVFRPRTPTPWCHASRTLRAGMEGRGVHCLVQALHAAGLSAEAEHPTGSSTGGRRRGPLPPERRPSPVARRRLGDAVPPGDLSPVLPDLDAARPRRRRSSGRVSAPLPLRSRPADPPRGWVRQPGHARGAGRRGASRPPGRRSRRRRVPPRPRGVARSSLNPAQLVGSPSVRFSIWPTLTQPWSDVLAVTLHAEATGWDGVYVADHFMGAGDTAGGARTPSHEGTAALAALGQATERLRIGSLVFSITYRHPSVLANWAASLDHVSNGRLQLGIGAGWQENEHAQYGIDLGPPHVRLERLVEACQVILGLLREDVTNFRGEYFVLTEAIAEPKPVQQPIPLLIGGKGDRMMGVVARYADAWNAWGRADVIAERAAVLDARCTALGRDPASIQRSCQALWFMTDDEARADELIAASPTPAIGGSAARLAEAVSAWRDAGVDEVIVPDFTLGRGAKRLERMDLIISEVAAPFR